MTPLVIPFPPSVNRMYRVFRGRAIVSAVGRAYRAAVTEALAGTPKTAGRVSVRIVAHPPDNRRRDLDNLLKASLDGLVHGGALEDDSQIDDLRIVRGENKRHGELSVVIQPVEAAT
jgi:crossover junction endodeoxyribonuclease RusA